ncbi:FtsK/SpoIIIE domain-containing protein [Streptomyces sp. URMC 129]|uniref:FtsK/SpoIIIE domain-containing protein n=1 Tax=Streptomyces sp. URMC 129 TaxID=3423407 RepID=UPI003F1AB86D
MLIDREPLLGNLVSLLSRLMWRHRSVLAPLWFGGVVYLAAAFGNSRYPDSWKVVAAFTAVLCVLLGVPYGLLERHPYGARAAAILARMWSECGMSRAVERSYGAVVFAVTGSWYTAAVLVGPHSRPLPVLWITGMIGCGLPWWLHRRRRARVRVEHITEDWPGLAESMGLPGSRIVSAVVDAWGWTGRLALRKGSTVDDAVSRIPAVESALGARAGSVRILPDKRRADRCIVRVIDKDPHATTIPWPKPAKGGIEKPIRLGLFEDGREVSVSFLRRHVLVGGVVGSGKSGVVNVILGALSSCADVVIWGIDLKEGMELAPWKQCLGRLATTGMEAERLLRDAVAELESRARTLASQGRRVWEPAYENPALVLVIDEYAELSERACEYADSIARRGRAVAVTLIVATQRPTQKTMGGATRTQMDIRVCLRVREKRDADLILGQGYAKSGWNAERLSLPGSFLLSGPEHHSPARARAYLVTDDDVRQHVADVAHGRPRLAHFPRASVPPLKGPQTAVERSSWAKRPQEDSGASQGPESALWDVLSRAGEEGVTVGGLMEATGMGRSWVYLRLRQHADAGDAVQLARGRWRAAGGQEQHQGPTPSGPSRTRRARRARRRQHPPNRDTR